MHGLWTIMLIRRYRMRRYQKIILGIMVLAVIWKMGWETFTMGVARVLGFYEGF